MFNVLAALVRDTRRTPQGVRGLKYGVEGSTNVRQLGRTPQGVRGLKLAG